MTDTTVATTTAFPKFEITMLERFADYQWEAIENTTADGYILNTFHIYKDGVSDDTLPPIFFQHGGTQSADDWLSNQPDTSSPFFELVDAGHHVYLGNNRGVEYSQGHTTITDPAEFYDYDYSGYFDDVASQTSAMMSNYQGSAQGIYVGYSLGTLQMLGALSMASLSVAPFTDILQNIQHAILLAPCTVLDNGSQDVGTLSGLGIASIPSDNWEADVATVCDTLGADSVYCYFLSSIDADFSGRIGTKLSDHMAQNTVSGIFGSYVSDWDNSASPQWGSNPPVEWPLAGIEMPITLVVAENDTECTPERAEELATQFSTNGNLAGVYTILEQDHLFFVNGTATEYTDLLEQEVANVIAGNAISVDGPFYTNITIVPEDEDDSALSGLSTAFALAFALLQFVF